MRHMKLALLSLLMLSGAAVGFVASAGPAAPALKPGLWELHAQSSAGGAYTASPTTTVCESAAQVQEDLGPATGVDKKDCSKYESREVDGKWILDAVCSAQGHTVTLHKVVNLSGDRIQEKNSIPPNTWVSDSRWVGACKLD